MPRSTTYVAFKAAQKFLRAQRSHCNRFVVRLNGRTACTVWFCRMQCDASINWSVDSVDNGARNCPITCLFLGGAHVFVCLVVGAQYVPVVPSDRQVVLPAVRDTNLGEVWREILCTFGAVTFSGLARLIKSIRVSEVVNTSE